MQLTSGQAAIANTPIDSRVRIVETLWRHPGLSRIELADRLGMDKSTMSRSVGRLIETGMIFESEAQDSGPLGGRRRVGLAIRGDWGIWLGLELQPDQVRGVLVDFSGEIRGGYLFDEDVRSGGILPVLEKARDSAFVQASETGLEIRGVSIAVPGPVRPGSGIVERSRPLGITEPMDLAGPAAEVFGMPVGIGNDVDQACRGELHFSDLPENPSFLYLFAEARRSGLSLGLGTVFEGNVHSGDHGAGGEIMSIYRSNGSEQLALERRQVELAARNDDALGEVARELAPQVALLANVLDIDRLILGGLFSSRYEVVSGLFADALGRRRTYPDLADPVVSVSARGDESVAYGAAIHFTEHPSRRDYWRTV